MSSSSEGELSAPSDGSDSEESGEEQAPRGRRRNRGAAAGGGGGAGALTMDDLLREKSQNAAREKRMRELHEEQEDVAREDAAQRARVQQAQQAAEHLRERGDAEAEAAVRQRKTRPPLRAFPCWAAGRTAALATFSFSEAELQAELQAELPRLIRDAQRRSAASVLDLLSCSGWLLRSGEELPPCVGRWLFSQAAFAQHQRVASLAERAFGELLGAEGDCWAPSAAELTQVFGAFGAADGQMPSAPPNEFASSQARVALTPSTQGGAAVDADALRAFPVHNLAIVLRVAARCVRHRPGDFDEAFARRTVVLCAVIAMDSTVPAMGSASVALACEDLRTALLEGVAAACWHSHVVPSMCVALRQAAPMLTELHFPELVWVQGAASASRRQCDLKLRLSVHLIGSMMKARGAAIPFEALVCGGRDETDFSVEGLLSKLTTVIEQFGATLRQEKDYTWLHCVLQLVDSVLGCAQVLLGADAESESQESAGSQSDRSSTSAVRLLVGAIAEWEKQCAVRNNEAANLQLHFASLKSFWA